jgi:hypothetical protein
MAVNSKRGILGIGEYETDSGANPIGDRLMNPRLKAEIAGDVAKLRGAPAPAATSTSTAGTSPTDTGVGFAIIDGKRINYGDIGTSRDPLKNSGGFVMANRVQGIGDTQTDPAIGAMDREIKRIQGVQDEANLSGIGYMRPKAARKAIALRQNQQQISQQGEIAANDLALRRELGLGKQRLDQGQQDETARHNKAMEGLKKSEIEKTGVDVKDTDMIRNMNYLVQSGVATDAKDAHAILNGKKGGRDDFVSRVVQARIKSYHDNQLLNKDPLDMNQVINEANQAADKLFPNSRQGQSVPAAPQPSAPAPTTQQATAPAISPTSAAPSAFDPYVFRPVSQGLNDGPYTKNLRELGIKAKRPNIETFFNSK